MDSEVTDGMKAAMAALDRVMELPEDQRRDYLEMLGHAATIYMRLIGGEDYVRGWLNAALADLDKPPTITLRRPQ
jgi:hypothetical protein